MTGTLDVAAAADILHREALALDERRWDDWLALYLPDAVYWVPAWKSEAEQTNDPDTEISLIYYETRDGLKDRVWRLRSGQSVASTPLRRTAHLIGNVLIAEAAAGDVVVKSSGVVHCYDPKRRTSHALFSLYEHRLRSTADGWRIAGKTVRLQNDNIPAVVDVYML